MVAAATLLILLLGAAVAFLHLPALEGARGTVVARLLGTYLGEPIVVAGGVELDYGATIRVAAHGVTPITAESQGRSDAPLGTVSLSFARGALLRGRLQLAALDVSGVRVIVDAAEPSGQALGARIAAAVGGTLRSPLIRDLTLKDIRILRINDAGGWNETLVLERVSSHERSGAVTVEARGSVNDRAFQLAGALPDLSAGTDRGPGGDVSLQLTTKGVQAAIKGQLATGDKDLEFAGRLDVDSASLGDLQELFGLARIIDGNGSLQMTLKGELPALEVPSIGLRVETTDDRVYQLKGRAQDLWNPEGVDLTFAATLIPPGAARSAAPLDLAPRAIRGRLSSRAGGFEIDEAVIETGLASFDLEEIGPIRIGQIARDAQGRLRFEDIELVQGDAKDPMLTLTGHVHNVLALRDYGLDGSFRLPMAALLTGQPDATGLGALRGELTLSDARGHLALDRLAAKLRETDSMSLSLRLAERPKGREGLDVELDVPDWGAVARTLGGQSLGGRAVSIPLAFDGTLGREDDGAGVDGSLRIGRTALRGEVRISTASGKPEISGTIAADALYLDDLGTARDVAALVAKRKSTEVRLNQDIQDRTTLSLKVSAKALEGQSGDAGSLDARLFYAASDLKVSIRDWRYLGGSIQAELTAGLAHGPPALHVQASVRELALAQVFTRLQQPPAASGPLDLDLDVRARGDDLHALLASMTGQVSASIRDGRLADRTINLAGQHIIGWLFDRSPDGSAPLDCVIARFDLEDGSGTARELVFETDKVQAPGGGTLDLRAETLELRFIPRPKREELIGRVGEVHVRGPLSHPEIQLADGAVAGKVIGDTLGLPLHLLGSLVGANGRLPTHHRPCVVAPGAQ